jgi:DNA-binding transcriptional regulator GbsR (MarR family)
MKIICDFLSLVKEGANITEISEALGLSRERVTKHYRKQAVEIVTDEFLKVVKTRKVRYNTVKLTHMQFKNI